jgi:hypothetical protein
MATFRRTVKLSVVSQTANQLVVHDCLRWSHASRDPRRISPHVSACGVGDTGFRPGRKAA